jgi:hypothetical protein
MHMRLLALAPVVAMLTAAYGPSSAAESFDRIRSVSAKGKTEINERMERPARASPSKSFPRAIVLIGLVGVAFAFRHRPNAPPRWCDW